ncbi:MAG: spermidine/putrescine ABC transporter substrate-binding protein [Chloroflexota bacterium]|nr:MAG: spermidine/putrescine ABC transporter substrate-binding protein [Chloroflexota bacterium]
MASRTPRRLGSRRDDLREEKRMKHNRILQRQRLTRRGFFYVAGVGGTAAFLAACGGQTASPTSAPPTTASAGAPTAGSAALEKDLFIYNWADYVSQDNIDAFGKANDVKVTLDFYQSNEDLLAKIEAGGTGYDVVAPTGYMVQIMADKGMLLPLDMSRIPNYKYMSPPFDKGRPHDPDNKWSVTKDWGTTGIAWNTEKIKEDVTSLEDFWNLAEKYSGKVAVMDSSPEVIGLTLKLLGYSYNSCDQAELDAALKKLLELKPHLKAFDSSYFDLLATDEIWMSLSWNGDVFNANSKRKDAGKPESINYVIAKEGGELWEDDWVILKNAPHPNAALAWINFVLDPQNQAKESEATFYASGEDEAKKYMSEEITSNHAIYPSDEVLAKMEAAQVLPGDCLQAREELWTKLKSA